MINKSNELPSFVNETNLPKIVDKLTDASNIKIANNKYGNRVQTVIDKIVKKADDVTKAIKQEVVNNSYSFKVGTGNVDVSTDVQDGFGEVGVKGVTYQNLLNDFSFSGEASKYITVNENTIKWTKSAVTTSNINIKYHNSLAQLDKTYTLVFYIYKNTLQREGAGDSYNVAKFNIVSYNGGVCLIPVNKTGLVKVKLIQPTTTPSDGKPYLEVYKDSVGELEISYPILLEGDYTNDNKIPSQFEGIVGVGDKSKNLFNKDNIKQTVLNLGAVGSNCDEVVSQVRCSLRKISCKPNTKYTIKSDKEINAAIGSIGNNNIALGDSSWRNIYNSYTYTTPSDAIELAVNIAKTDNTNIDIDYVKNFNIQLEEGSTATSYEPYYDGHKIEILSNGKNLFDIQRYLSDNENSQYYKISADGGLEILKLDSRSSFKNLDSGISVKRNTAYSIKCSLSWDSLRVLTQKNNVWSNIRPTNYQFYSGDSDMIYIKFVEDKNFPKIVTHIQVEESSTPSSYQPCFADKTQILLDEPLMRLPSGVCDEITRDGKLIKRVGKIIFTGIESWNLAKTSDKTILFEVGVSNIKIDKRGDILPICDKLLASLQSSIWVNDIEGVSYTDSNSNRFRIRINKNRLDTQDLTGFKKWLSQNPTTVYYELAESVITELPAPYLRIFKDGHLTFNTLVAPESTHLVQLNKSAQIQNAIKESQSLDNRINVLENNYDNLMLSTISRLNDLELNYTLK